MASWIYVSKNSTKPTRYTTRNFTRQTEKRIFENPSLEIFMNDFFSTHFEITAKNNINVSYIIDFFFFNIINCALDGY